MILRRVKQRGFELVAIYEEEETAWKAGHPRALAQVLADTRKGCRWG